MRRLVGSLALLFLSFTAAYAEPTAQTLQPAGQLCRQAIAIAEKATSVPPQLMAAIARVESGRSDPATGQVQPWPWTVDAEGQGSYYDTKAQAIAAVRALQARGIRSIDVGCMQVNLLHHPGAFASLEAAFDPATNVGYAAKFLSDLHAQSGDWTRAAALYHSATPELAAAYQRKVLAVWPEERRLAGGSGVPAPLNLALAPGGARFSIPATLPHGPAPIGRDLGAYRAAPVLYTMRPLISRGG